jgi:hypothetical protein
MRQPHASSVSVDINPAIVAPTPDPSRVPTPEPQAAIQSATPRRGTLDQEHHRTRVLAADRKPLDHAQQNEQHRGQQAERRVAGKKAHQEGRHRHRGDRDRQGGAASVMVTDMTDQRTADRPHQVPEREHGEGREQLRHPSWRGKKLRPIDEAK